MEIHIGEIIKNKARELRIGPTELGDKINTSKQNVYGIYKRKSIDTALLRKISNALGHNFFSYYVTSLEFEGHELGIQPSLNSNEEKVDPRSLLEINQVKIETLKNDLDVLLQIHEILKEKMATSR